MSNGEQRSKTEPVCEFVVPQLAHGLLLLLPLQLMWIEVGGGGASPRTCALGVCQFWLNRFRVNFGQATPLNTAPDYRIATYHELEHNFTTNFIHHVS